MKTHSLAAGLLALSLAWIPARPAVAATDIPTSVTGPVDSAEYPDPICITCVVRTQKSEPTRAVIEIDYLESAPFDGAIVVTVWLGSGRYDQRVITDVELAYGDLARYEVTAGARWTWDDASKVVLELVPRQ